MTDLSVVDNVYETVGVAGEAALDTVVGGAAIAADAVRRPRRTAARTRRRGSEAIDAVTTAAGDAVDDALSLPERALVGYVRLLRRQGHRDDVLGTVSRTVLGAVHGQAREAARFFTRLERETTTPATTKGRTRGSATRARARKPATNGRRRTAR